MNSHINMTAALLLLINCAAVAEEQHVAVKFDAVVGDKAFVCGQSYDNIGITQSRITPSDFRFFISAVELLDERGKAVALTLDQDEVWQYQDVALLDFEDGTGPCHNGNPGLHREITGRAPKGDYRGVRFTLGVPFELNHGDPTIAPSPLNLTAMFWVWQAGYKFVKIDMATTGQPQAAETAEKQKRRASGFPIHLGSTDCASASLTTPPSGCKNPNRLTLTFNNFDLEKNSVIADVAVLLNETNVDINATDTAPGCMSSPVDTDCAQVMPAFGLPFGGNAAAQQRFFKVR